MPSPPSTPFATTLLPGVYPLPRPRTCLFCLLIAPSSPSAELVRNWLVRQLPDRPHPEIYRPINWFAWGVTAIIGLAIAGAVAKLWPYVLPVLQSRNAWAAISLLGILLFTSGHMFNQIRKAPYVAADGRGGVAYFAPGFQNQYGLETQIIAFLCKSSPSSRLVILEPDMTLPRWSTGLCDDLSCRQGPSREEPQGSARHGDCLGSCSVPRLQLPSAPVQRQERRIPLQAAAFRIKVWSTKYPQSSAA